MAKTKSSRLNLWLEIVFAPSKVAKIKSATHVISGKKDFHMAYDVRDKTNT